VQLVFSTAVSSKGWAKLSMASRRLVTYVLMVKAVDFNDAAYFQKGLVTLIR
jgi:hypothetical protein